MAQAPGLADATGPAEPSDAHRPSAAPRPSLVVLLVVAVVAGLVSWWLFGRTDSTSDTQPVPPSIEQSAPLNDARADEPSPAGDSIGQIAVDAIDDADAAVDAINADAGEADLLAELGLDPTGRPLEAAASDPVGHQFTWRFPDGLSITIVVDSVTGDHSYLDSTGLAFRKVGELAFGRSTSSADWAMIDDSDLASIQRLGLDRPLTVDDLVGGPVAAYTSVSGDGSIWSIDEAAFDDADAVGRDEWVGSLGLPIDSPPGTVTIWLSTAADGSTVSTASIERAASGETVVYELSRLFDESPDITAPEL